MHDIGKAALSNGYLGLFSLLLEDLDAKNWNVPMNFVEEVVRSEPHDGWTHTGTKLAVRRRSLSLCLLYTSDAADEL